MEQALLYGIISGFGLVIGSTTGLFFKFRQTTIAKIMAFGSGVLICALTFGLMTSAFDHGGFDAVIVGFLSGGLIFILGDYLIHKAGGRRHKKHQHIKTEHITNGQAIVLGAILDGIPESVALGIAIFSGKGLGVLMLCAIFLSNFPEGISSVSGLLKEGYKRKSIIFMWFVVAVVCTFITIISYSYFNQLDINIIGVIEAFAAGAMLAMLADAMMPEAFEEGGSSIGLLTVLGFITAFIISKI